MNKLAISLIIMIVLSLLFSGLNTHANGSGGNLVGYWRFDEGSGTTASDSSGNGNTGTLHGGAAWTDGRFAKALDFSGVDGYVQIPQSSSLDVTAQVTVEAWVNLRAYVDSVGYESHVVSRSDDAGGPLYVLCTHANGKIGYDIGVFTGYHQSAATLPLNSWTHLAMTYNGASVCLYINGVPDSNYAQSGSIPTTSNWLAIGCKPTGTHGGPGTYAYTNGIIDDVRIYNRALSQQEIQDDMGVPRGPRTNTLNIKYYSGSTALYDALKNGDVGLTDMGLTLTQMQDAFNDSNLQTAVSPADSIYEFDFNNNATTPTYPNWTNPTAYKGFRQGIAYLVDKTYFAGMVAYSTRIDTPVARPLGDSWVDWSMSQFDPNGNLLANYPYEYNSTLAAQYFDQAGFVQGNITNPDYNTDFPGSAQFLRVYPPSHPKHGQNLDPLIFIIRDDYPRSLYGEYLAGELSEMGIPVDATEVNASYALLQVIERRDYNIYTGGWGNPAESWIEPVPDPSFPSYLELYKSSDANNWDYPQFRNATYDESCQELDSPSNLLQARNAALKCQEILVQEAACVWLYSTCRVTAYRDLSGVTNLRGGGIDNQWTFLRAAHGENSSSTEFDYGLLTVPPSLNVITDYYDLGTSDCLGLIYDTLLSYCPYDKTPGTVCEESDRGGTMPWIAKDWDIGVWQSPYTPGSNLTKLTFHLRDGVRWHDGIGLNSTDVEFTIEYLQSLGSTTTLLPFVSDVHHVTAPDATTVEVYENVSNVRTLDEIGKLPILPKHIFQNIINVTGYTPGANEGHPANETLIGCGPWKYVSNNSSMLCLEANRDYFMETPSGAEVDFRYDWKLGCWVVDAMDATMVGEAFGSRARRGTSGPDARWEPGCDLNGDGKVDMLDIILLHNKFNNIWGESVVRSIAEPPDCAMYVEPAQGTVLLGQDIIVYVKSRNLNQLSGFQFKLNYDNTMLNCFDMSLSPIFNNTMTMENVVNQTTGLIRVSVAPGGPANQVSGNVTLATITFNTTQSGSSPLHLWDTELAAFGAQPGSTSQPLPHQEIDTGVTIGVPTSTGTNVTVTPAQNVAVTFASVTAQGFTSLNTTQPPSPQFVSVVCDEITTNATYTGNITLQLPYNAAGLSLQDQQAMKIWLWNDSSACWVDITTGVNTTSHVVHGVSPHLSMFGVTSDLGITGDMGIQGTTTVSIPSAPPAPPYGLAALNYYQINTTKSLSVPISLSLAYNHGNIPPEEEIFTRMWMRNESSASWVDITTGVNTTDHTVYGSAPHLSMFGVTSLPQPPDGITVASANCPKTVVCQSYSANVSVTIRNQGDFPQTNLNVYLYCNTTLLPTTYQIVELNPGAQETLNFTWNTSVGWAKGNYSISTYSHRIGWVYVAMVGDVKGDGKVDGKDLGSVAWCFGSYPGAPPPMSWDPNADINNDGKIDGKDLGIVAWHFGEPHP
jgi:ABC-type transport system substrate-binding protein